MEPCIGIGLFLAGQERCGLAKGLVVRRSTETQYLPGFSTCQGVLLLKALMLLDAIDPQMLTMVVANKAMASAPYESSHTACKISGEILTHVILASLRAPIRLACRKLWETAGQETGGRTAKDLSKRQA